MLKYKNNIMNDFLNDCINNETELTIYLLNKRKIEGLVRSFDDDCIIVEDHGHWTIINRKHITVIKYLEDNPMRGFCNEVGLTKPNEGISLRKLIRKLLGRESQS